MKLGVAELSSLSQLLDIALDLPADQQSAWVAALGPEHEVLRPVLQQILELQTDAQTNDLLSRLPQLTQKATDYDGWLLLL